MTNEMKLKIYTERIDSQGKSNSYSEASCHDQYQRFSFAWEQIQFPKE